MRFFSPYVSLSIEYLIMSRILCFFLVSSGFFSFQSLLLNRPFATSEVLESWNAIGTDLESTTPVRHTVHWILKTASLGKRRPGSPWDNLLARGKILSFRGHGSADCNGVIVLMPIPPPYGWAFYPREISCSTAERIFFSSTLYHHM